MPTLDYVGIQVPLNARVEFDLAKLPTDVEERVASAVNAEISPTD
jgi:hypothetical protein